MANDTIVTIVGNCTAEPELRFTPSGAAVANFTIASTPRAFDRQSNDWKDGETLFMRCSVWKQQAENAASTLHKGMRVIAQGRLKSRSFDTKEGDRRTVIELDVEEVGPSLLFAEADVHRTDSSGTTRRPSQHAQQGGFGQQSGQPQNDPWGQQGAIDSSQWGNGANTSGGGAGPYDEPGF